MNQITNFRTLIATLSDRLDCNEKLLPISHIPRRAAWSAIRETGFLKPAKGNQYFENEDLVFFSYGRASYIPKNKIGLANDIYPPIVFVFDLTKIQLSPVRVLPFDSGGFEYYGMEKYFVPIQFSINKPSHLEIKKFVIALFKSCENYIKNKHHISKEFGNTNFFPEILELRNHYDKITDTSTIVGLQGKTFEIHYGEPVQFEEVKVLYPKCYATNPKGREEFESQFPGMKPIPYIDDPNPMANLKNINKMLTQIIEKTPV